MMKWILSIIGCLLCLPGLEASESQIYLGSRESDPASLVENVSTVNGDYTEVEIDLTVPAPDCLILSRFYSSRDTLETANFGGWRFNPHCFLYVHKDSKKKSFTNADGKFEPTCVVVGNPDGTILTYFGWKNVTNSSKKTLFKIDPERDALGLSNTAKGNICAWTNQKNNELYFNAQTDSFELSLCSEGKRSYTKHPSLDIYLITQEILPSGNKVFYEFDEKGQLILIKETNASEKKVIAWITIKYGNEIHVETSDGKTANYHFQEDPSGARLLTAVERSNKPPLRYQYQVINNRALLVKKTLPEERHVQVNYYLDNNQHKVKSLTDGTGSTSIHFSYETMYTKVDGPGNRQAVYRFNEENRLVGIEQYLDCSLYRVYKKAWGKRNDAGNLVSSSIEDSSGNVFYYKSFSYDNQNKGNIIQECEYGNLTGAGEDPLSFDEDGKPTQEAHIKTYAYFSGKNTNGFLQRDKKETAVKCWYAKGTNRLIKRFIISNNGSIDREDGDKEDAIQKRHFYDYNEDGALTRIIIDDGHLPEAKPPTNIRERHITVISPKQDLPNVGAPEIIDEMYRDIDGRKDVLIKRTHNQFDAQGLIVSQAVYDANSTHCYTLLKGYNEGLLGFETDPMGNEIHYFYDANQNLIQMTRSDTGISIEYQYDLKNRLVSTLTNDKMGNQFETQVAYDLKGYRALEIDRFGNETIYVNDSLGRPIQITYPECCDGLRTSTRPTYTFSYGLFDNLLTVSDPKGRLLTTSFNSRGSPTTIQHHDGSHELFKYDTEGSLHRYLGRDGFVQVFEYDYIGRLNHIEYYRRGSKGSTDGFKRRYYSYNAFHLISEQDEIGGKTTYTYDGAGRLATLNRGNQKVEFAYDALGRTHAVKKWKSPSTFTLELKEYDLLNRITERQTQDSDGHTLTKNKCIYNDAGQLIQVLSYPQNQVSIVAQYEYDSLGRVCKIIGTANQITTISYDDHYINEWGLKTLKRTTIDPLGNKTEEIFDNADHLIQVSKRDTTGRLLAEVESSYDILGNKVREGAARFYVDEILNPYETEWSFNQANQLQSIILGKGTLQERASTFEYNSYGELTTRYNPSSKDPINYQYNDSKTSQTISYKDGKKDISHRVVYDLKHNITEIKLASAQTLTYSYDANDLLLSETIKDEFGTYQVNCIYDGEGYIQTLKLPDGSSIQYNYEGSFVKRVTRFNIEGKELYYHTVTARDLMGNILEETLPGYGGERKQAWDSIGRRVAITTDFFEDRVLEEGYDLLDNIKKRETTLDNVKSTTEYEYNALTQLILEGGEVKHQYAYDSLGNRLQKDSITYKIDALNQLLEAEGASYAYDANGNLTSKTIGKRVWLYEWNPLNQLISIKDPDQNVISLTYDLTGKRLTKKIELKGKKPKTFRFFYLGNMEIGSLDEKGVIAELKIPSNPNYPEIFPCVAIEIKNDSYIPLYDLQGNIKCLIDHQKRQIVESYRYTAYGEEEIIDESGRAVSDTVVGNPWRYQGKRVDREVGFIYYGQRYYDSNTGRWVSPDPAGNIDGPNLYAFVQNNPMTYVDYFGLAAEKNENQNNEFRDYFYGEYEPKCHCEAHRDCKRGSGIATTIGNGISFAGISDDIVNFVLTSPRFQGSMQALGGLAETSFGGGMTLATYGAGAPIGWPIMAHGLDHFITGIGTAITGRPRDTITAQLLQKVGMSHQTAGLVNSGLSIGGTMWATAVIRSCQLARFPQLYLSKSYAINVVQENEQILFGQKSVSAFFSEVGKFKGQPISEIVRGLRNGTISPESLPLEVIVRNGQTITLNNRSLLVLKRAGIKPKTIIDKTGIKKYEERLDAQLKGILPSDVIRVRGGEPGASFIGPID